MINLLIQLKKLKNNEIIQSILIFLFLGFFIHIAHYDKILSRVLISILSPFRGTVYENSYEITTIGIVKILLWEDEFLLREILSYGYGLRFSSVDILPIFLIFYSKIIPILVLLIYIKYGLREKLFNYGFKNPCNDISTILMSVFISCLVLTIYLQFYKIRSIFFSNYDMSTLIQISIIPIAFIAVDVFCQEFMTRGFLQVSLAKKMGNYKSILLSSVLFTLLHVTLYNNLLFLILIFGVSIILGYLFSRKNNLFPPLILHFSLNFLGWIFGSFI